MRELCSKACASYLVQAGTRAIPLQPVHNHPIKNGLPAIHKMHTCILKNNNDFFMAVI